MLSVIIVSWNTRDWLRRCLESVKAGRGDLVLELIVVDNGSGDGTPQLVRDRFPEVILVESERNVGFTGGNNLGLALAKGEWLMLLNPDAEVTGNALPRLVQFLEDNPTAGVVGPRLLYGDGSFQSTRRRFPTLLTLFFESTRFQRVLGPHLRRYYMEAQPRDTSHPVDWLMEAALLLRREVYEHVGGLDERFFMYFEETDWQRRIKAAGWPVWYVPGATVIHHEGASSGQVVGRRLLEFNRSRIRYTVKWHGARWGALLRVWLLFLVGLEWVVEAAKWLVGHRRPLRQQRLREYAQVLRGMVKG